MNYKNYVKGIEGLTAKFARSNPDLYISMGVGEDGVEIYVGEKEILRANWVLDRLSELGIGDTAYEILVDDPDRKIMVVSFTDEFSTCIGVAKCSPTDDYDRNVGLAVAYARAYNDEVPSYI